MNKQSPTALSSTRQWSILAIVLIGAFMSILDSTIVNVAIASIHHSLHASFGLVELVITAYTIVYAALLITGGRLGDIFGRKRLFIIGLTVFGGASALCGMAPSIGLLIGARALQGVGGALFYPQVLSIIQRTFSGNERTKALGAFGSVLGLAAISGQIIGGLLLSANLFGLTWRPIFLVNVPLAIIAIIGASIVMPTTSDREKAGLDFGGVALITLTIVSLSVPLLEGQDLHWPLWTFGMLAASIVFGACFIWYESRLIRRGKTPLIRLPILKRPTIRIGVPIAALFMMSYASYIFLLSVYLQSGLGFSPLHSGLTYAPSAIGFFIGSFVAPRLIPILGRYVLEGGYIIAAIGMTITAVSVAAVGAHVASWELIPGLLIQGTGLGLGFSPLVGTIVSGLEPSEAGSGAGIVTTVMQTGNVLGVALGGLLFFTILGHFKNGAAAYAHSFAIMLSLSGVALLTAAFLVRRLPRSTYEEAGSLIERLPNWASGFAYSMFLVTGGRISDRTLKSLFRTISNRRMARAKEAPDKPSDFLRYHFRASQADQTFIRYLMREALIYDGKRIPHEAERLPVIREQIAEIERRQQQGLLPKTIDPDILRLATFSLLSYPFILPQITHMLTSTNPDEAAFQKRWEDFLSYIGNLMEQDAKQRSRA